MSSSYIIEPEEKETEKEDDTLIIVVNDDGTISVDQETLQNIIMNQSNANVSVVRLGQSEPDANNGEITLTVDPSTFISPVGSTTTTDATNLADPFMEMDPEQLKRLETALQSEEAKQILGENVTAMLDMLSVEEQQNSIRYSVELDHCYTSKVLPSDPKPREALPNINYPTSSEVQYSYTSSSLPCTMSPVPSPTNDADNLAATKLKATTKTGKQIGRPRKNVAVTPTISPRSAVNTSGISKLTGHLTNKNETNVSQHSGNKASQLLNEDGEEDEFTSSTSESSESEPPSDNDSDFGIRGPRRGGIRARGGRKGLTTRGGNTVGTRRRGPNKHMDIEQVRRLDMEMAAAVNAMKTPEKEEKSGMFNLIKGKRQCKSFGWRKKDELHRLQISSSTENATISPEKPVLASNQVKTNLMSTNTIKNDLIVTKSDDGQNNSKITIVQKQVLMKGNELRTIDLKKQNTSPKVTLNLQSRQEKETLLQVPPPQQLSQSHYQEVQLQQQHSKTVPSVTSVKTKITDIRKERRKSEKAVDLPPKSEIDQGKSIEAKTLENVRKQKKENKKLPAFVAEALGPALFSAPDIIRRVGSNNDPKNNSDFDYTNKNLITNTLEQPSHSEEHLNIESDDRNVPKVNSDPQKTDEKIVPTKEIQSSLNTIPNISSEGISQTIGPSPVSDHTIPKHSGIEGEEHLLATLEMEASKHDEELLAEALLLQEELGVDLTDHPELADNSTPVSEPLASSVRTFPLIISEEGLVKPLNTTTQAPENITQGIQKKNKDKDKDDKEPIQIVRGGRVITLPPIEAPATRSKRLQAKTEFNQKSSDLNKKNEKLEQQLIQHQTEHKETIHLNEDNDDDDDDDEDEEDNSDSEDDPDRLWCICKRPHNNRFMICCDVCEDWFHGKCVHVSKAMGQQMEEKGIEWVCPNCVRKKTDDTKLKSSIQLSSGKEKMRLDSITEDSTSQKDSPKVVKDVSFSFQTTLPHTTATHISGTTQCVVCKKEARNSSIYCSDACILAHAQETLTKDKLVSTGSNMKVVKVSPTDSFKAKSDARVIVFDRKSGRLLTGLEAPKKSNLKTWLKENPTFEVIRPNAFNPMEIGGKTITVLPAQKLRKTGKSPQVLPTKIQGLPSKAMYSSLPETKQTVLTPNNKKAITIALQPQINTGNTKPIQIKQTLHENTGRTNIVIKQITTKTIAQPQTKVQGIVVQKQIPNKKQDVKPTVSQVKQLNKPNVKKPETEPIRLNIRKTLTELLLSRIKETTDLKLSNEEVAELADNIELELYKYFKDTGAKYKAKYRSLVFNIKDTKNLTLFRKIANRSLTPDAVVRLSPDEMASQELAEWREKETKHQLEMIKKNELDLMAQAKSIVVKTHKGEQIIENDGGIGHVDPKTPVQDIVTALNSSDNISSTADVSYKDKEEDDRTKLTSEVRKLKNIDEIKKKDKESAKDNGRSKCKDEQERSTNRSRHRHRRDRDHSKTREKSRDRKTTRNKESRRDKDRERGRDKERQRDRDREKEKQKHQNGKKRHKSEESWGRSRSQSSHRESKDSSDREQGRKKEIDRKKESLSPTTDKPIEDRLWRHIEDETTTNTIYGNDSDLSDREPSSTVTIKTPDINEEPERYTEPDIDKDIDRDTSKVQWQTVWRGFVNMVDVAKFFITAQEVSGHAKDLMNDLPDTVDVVGRISHETVWDYISKMKKTGSKEILVIRLTAANDEEKIPYITLYSYLNSRSRLGVVGNVSKNIKDFYIMPFSNQSTVPRVLLPLNGPGFEENRPHLLLGIIVRNKKKRLATIPTMISTKIQKKDPDRSYTPPLVGNSKDKTASTTPPVSPRAFHKTSSNDTIKDKQTVMQMTLDSLNKAHIGMSKTIIDNATICKIVPELSSKIDLIPSPDKVAMEDDGDEPYSPGEMDDEIHVTNIQTQVHDSNDILTPSKNSTELQRKMDELNRQIEEQKQQIQNISSSFLGETMPTLPGLGLDPSIKDSEEAYSPSDARSFTPPPPSISKFAQPILDKVSDITIPPNLQEILANVKRQESSKVDPYLPSKPSATFLTTVNSTIYQNSEKYSSPSHVKGSNSTRLNSDKASFDVQSPVQKESKSTLSTLSDLDLIRKAEEELAAVAAVSATSNVSNISSTPSSASPTANAVPQASVTPPQCSSTVLPSVTAASVVFPPIHSSPSSHTESFKKNFNPEQPKPPGLEDEDFPAFPSTPPTMDSKNAQRSKFAHKSGIVLSVKRKVSEDISAAIPNKTSRTKSRWGQGPPE